MRRLLAEFEAGMGPIEYLQAGLQIGQAGAHLGVLGHADPGIRHPHLHRAAIDTARTVLDAAPSQAGSVP